MGAENNNGIVGSAENKSYVAMSLKIIWQKGKLRKDDQKSWMDSWSLS